MRELHGAFKSICDTYAISFTEFEQILDKSEEAFAVFDTDKNGIIDALELFTGLILFGDSQTEDKIKCKFYLVLFDLFDFNDVHSISKTDFEFLFLCCVSSACKMHQIADEVAEEPIESLIQSNFAHSSRVSLRDVLYFCTYSEEVNSFFQMFRIKGVRAPKTYQRKEILQPLKKPFAFEESKVLSYLKGIDQTQQAKLLGNLRTWMGAVLSPVASQHKPKGPSRPKVSLGWVFGIRSEDTKHNIQYAKEVLLYFVSSIVVVYYPKLLKQKHYLEHTAEVVSLAVGASDIVASGELSPNPKIHVWKLSSLENLEMLSGVHQGAVPLLAFSNQDQYIISCSFYTLVIYEWKTQTVLITTHHTFPIVDLVGLPRLESGTSCSFVVASEQDITLYTMQEAELNVSTLSLEASFTKSPIFCVMGRPVSNEDQEKTYVVLTGHEDGSVLVWAYLEFQRVLVTYEGSIKAIEKFYEFFAVGTSLGIIYLWDSNLEKCLKAIELSRLPFKMLSFNICSMSFSNKRLQVSSVQGDLVQLRVAKEGFKVIAKRVPGIVSIPPRQKVITFLDSSLPFVLFGGENSVVCVVDIRSYELMDAWSVGYPINAITCAKYENHFFYAVGCEEGAITVRKDWEIVSVPSAGPSTVTCLQLVTKGSTLVAATKDSNLHIYQLNKSCYEQTYIISIDTGIPLSMDLSKEGRHILIVNDKRKLMMMDSETFDLNFTAQEVASVKWNKLKGYFPVQVSNEQEYFTLPVCWNSKGDSFAAPDINGVIHFWKNASRVNQEEGLLLKGHTSPVRDLWIGPSLVFSLGYEDRTVLLWEYEPALSVNSQPKNSSVTSALLTEIHFSKPIQRLRRKHRTERFVQHEFLRVFLDETSEVFELNYSSQYPCLAQKLYYIYGSQTHLRNSLHYIHLHSGEQFKSKCERLICYFVSRYAVVMDPTNSSQSFYTLHKSRITAMEVHPSEPLVATSSDSQIDVWIPNTCTLRSRVFSSARSIYILKFHKETLAAVTADSDLYCVELFNWKNENLTNKIVLGSKPVQDLVFHPLEKGTIAICGVNMLSLWKKHGTNIKCKQDLVVSSEFTCMCYIEFSPGSEFREADLVLGSSEGSIYLCIEGRLLSQVEKAHQGAIFSLKVSCYKENLIVFTGGEDGFVCIWTSALKPLSRFHLSTISDPVISSAKSYSVTNFRVYDCSTKTQPTASLEELIVLVGTSGGALLEVNLFNVSSSEKLQIQYKVYTEGHCTQTKESPRIALHPDLHILASVSEDCTLKIWDYGNNALVLSKQLDTDCKPTSVNFSNTGMLALGFNNGVLVLLTSTHSAWGIGLKTPPETKPVFSCREANCAVLGIEFSVNDEFMAVSYDNYKATTVKETKTTPEILYSFVFLFQQTEAAEGISFRKFQKINLPNTKNISGLPNRSECAVTAMEFTPDCAYLGMVHQRVKHKEHLPDPSDMKPIFVVWEVNSGEIIENYEFIRKAQWKNLLMLSLVYSTLKVDFELFPNVNTMNILDNCCVMGTNTGQIHFCRAGIFAEELENSFKSDQNEGVDLWKKSRTFEAHSDAVTFYKVSKNQDYGFSCSLSENCIIQWELVFEQRNWEYDQMGYSIPSDIFGEIMSLDQFHRVLNELWIPRSELDCDSEEQVSLELEAIIGRSAHNRRNNLKYDSQERIIYVAASRIVIYNKELNSQNFLNEMANLDFGIDPEISCFCLSKDRRLVCYGTSEIECKVMLWDVCAYVLLASVTLKDCTQVLLVKLSSKSRYAAVVCLTNHYLQVLYLIEFREGNSQVVASALLSENSSFKVKDIVIEETKGLQIVTCGVQHLMFWKLNSDKLEYYSAQLSADSEDVKVAFLNCLQVNEVLLTGGDDGKIYIWREEKLLKRVSGHERCVLSMDANEDLGLVTTGGLDGHIAVWKLTVKQSTFGYYAQLDCLREYSLQDPEVDSVCYSVQSLCMGSVVENSFSILIGIQSGDIYELNYEEDSDNDTLAKVLKSIDAEVLCSISCDATSSFIYTLSKSGVFTVWDIESLAQVYCRDFAKKAARVIAFQSKHYVLLAFEEEVVVMQLSSESDEEINYELLGGFIIQAKNLTDVALSIEEECLAVASNPEQKPQVDIYLVHSQVFKLDKNLYGFRSPILRLDFSTDGFYLMCEDSFGEVLLFEIETQNIAGLQAVEFDIEWMGEGVRHSGPFKGIYHQYRETNKVLSVAKNLALSAVAVGDQVGCIKLYSLPYTAGSSMNSSTLHTGPVKLMTFTRNSQYLITYGGSDRCLIKWKLSN